MILEGQYCWDFFCPVAAIVEFNTSLDSFDSALPLTVSTTYSSDRLTLLAGGSLQINNVTEEEAGIYTCIADNGNQTIHAQAELIVQGKASCIYWRWSRTMRVLPGLFILILEN